MKKLTVAILEDDKTLLKDLHRYLLETQLVEVVCYASGAEEFMQKIDSETPEALIMDIDLQGGGMTGVDIAMRYKLPVLFVSGKTKDFLSGIEELNTTMEYPVEHITKPITVDKLKKILPKFILQIKSISDRKYVYLDFGGAKRNKINVDSIVYLGTDKKCGANSNNKVIWFNDRKPEILTDFTFEKMETVGLTKTQFVTIHKSFRVNVNHILRYTTEDTNHFIEVLVIDKEGKKSLEKLPVSDNYQKATKNARK